MIEFVRGTVARVGVDHMVVDVSGVGVRVQASPDTLAGVREGQTHELPTTLVVREDSWTLYGFRDPDEREVFETVQTVSGIGPRTAQALVATLTGNGVRAAVAGADERALTRAPGIGRKGAQRILLELSDRLAPPVGTVASLDDPTAGAAHGPLWVEDVVGGLVNLGWSDREVRRAVEAVVEGSTPEGGHESVAGEGATGVGDRAGQLAVDMSVAEAMRTVLRELNRS